MIFSKHRNGVSGRYWLIKSLLVMKLTVVLILCLSFQSFAKVYSQSKITLHLKSVNLKKALNSIEAKSDYYFVYSEQAQLNQVQVDVNSTDEPVLSVLNKMLANTGYTYEAMSNNLIIIRPAGQQQNISGIVYDEKNQPVPGVTIRVKGSSKVTVSNAQGGYSIDAKQGDILVVSFIGYNTQEVAVGSSNTLNVTLAVANQSLNEVVVVGYGTQLKKEVTAAVSQVKGSDIRKSSAPSISNALAGRVPGLIVNQRNGEPGRDDATVLVRGMATTGNASALIVIDGVANRDGISRIDPNDIETVTVLKDASASIYGAQAANGVILITTRRGKAGKTQLNYSFNQGYVSPTRLVKMADAPLYMRTINDINAQNGAGAAFTADQIAQYTNGTLQSTDWQNEVLKSHSLQSRHSVTMTGGSENVKYFLSAGTSSQNGLQKRDNTTGFKQYNFRTNIDAQATKRLSIGFDVTGRRENRNFLQQDQQTLFSAALLSDPTQPATIDGRPAAGRQNNNPLAIAEGPGYDRTEYNLINSTLKFKYDLPGVKGLFLDGFGAYDFNQSFQKIWAQPWSYYRKDASGNLISATNGPNSLNQVFNRNQSLTANVKLNFKRQFDKHDVSAFVAYEQNQVRTDLFNASRTNFSSTLVDQLFAGTAGSQQNGGSAVQGARQNYFGRVTYAYDGKYLFQGILRYDGSQIFEQDSRFGLFPGVSVGWVASEEPFLKGNDLISYLKVRASWSKLGNDRIAAFQYLNLYNYGAGYVFGGSTDVLALNPGVTANTGVTWETQITRDIGLEINFLNNKLTFEGDVFFNRRNNILGQRNVTVPDYTGIDLPAENIQKVKNNGFDANLNYNGSINKFRYTIGGNFTYTKNTLVFADQAGLWKYNYQNPEGYPIGSPLIYNVIGIYQNQADITAHPAQSTPRIGDFIYQDVNGDGTVTPDDRVRLPLTNIPQIQYGINLSFNYSGFDFTALIQGQAKAKQNMDYNVTLGTNGVEYFLKNAWRPDATGNSYARVGRSIAFNSSFFQDVAFARLKNIELGYTIPETILSKIGVQAMRIYFNGYNLLTVDGLKKKGLSDPENINEKGWRYPLTKSVNFGVNLTF